MKYQEPVNTIENDTGYILASKFYHKMFPEGYDACGMVENIDEKEWEVFSVKSESETAYYGIPLLGLGFFNCMILKEDTRDFLPEELEKLNQKHIALYGSHTGRKASENIKLNICQAHSLID